MLSYLSIENIAVIEKCDIEFNKGLNVLTGETGAGKSIIINALNAVLGQRTYKEIIRTGCNFASVSAKFDLLPEVVVSRLKELDIDTDDGIIISRTINADGRNICKINSVLTNLSVLREIGALLINIHGQFDNQLLLEEDNHYKYLDAYAQNSIVLEEYLTVYNQYKDIYKTLRKLMADIDDKESKVETLKYKINELSVADIKVGELKGLIDRRDFIRESEKIFLVLSSVMQTLNGDDENAGAVSSINGAYSNLMGIKRFITDSQLLEQFSVCNDSLKSLAEQLRSIYDSCSFDPGELQVIDDRIEVIQGLLKKYGPNEEDALNNLKQFSEELEKIELSDELIDKTQSELYELQEKLQICGEKLTKSRETAAVKFSKEVVEILKNLDMPNVVFEVDLSQDKYTTTGCDKVKFLISVNKGQGLRSLSKVASGGELSRIMLAIESLLSNAIGANTLIFDEIDTGISGFAAGKVGKQLKSVSKNKQVICVTHLAQIAAAAENHLFISKETKNEMTYTNVSLIDGDDRIKEIARIISGVDMTENLYNTSKELIESYK